MRKVRRSDGIIFIPITGVKKPLRNSRLLRGTNVKKKKKTVKRKFSQHIPVRNNYDLAS